MFYLHENQLDFFVISSYLCYDHKITVMVFPRYQEHFRRGQALVQTQDLSQEMGHSTKG